ncbi:MAG: hypothetical protein HYV13_03695, partial [Candidatus Doudnabacteria bacterium]|nr:hypothetical protein [Candidatus Doudnabacteria bacterium]
MQGEPRYILLSEAAKISGYSAEHLRRLCIAGKIKAHRLPNGAWVTTEEEVRKFVAESEDLSPRNPDESQDLKNRDPESIPDRSPGQGSGLRKGSGLQTAAAVLACLIVATPVLARLTHTDIQQVVAQKIRGYLENELGIRNYELGKVAGESLDSNSPQPPLNLRETPSLTSRRGLGDSALGKAGELYTQEL